ncbi:MAG TPA: ATP-binding cassette domain-containing protein [Marmoricola sp.]|nr:ATP-binding cassette domain-containing protein [Marmoricola sp.]
MIEFRDVGVSYPADDEGAGATLALHGADLVIPEGELTLVVGPTGSGKSTLLRCINGLVPHFSGGTLHGRVLVDGRDTRTHRPRDLADVVGFVMQDPVASFVTDTVEEELAYGMESLGVDASAMRRRVEETLDLLGLADVRRRQLRDLSGGQQQRVAIGAVLASGPRILVLDEPTSALDPVAAEEVLASLHRLVHDLGLTVVLAEHRLERVIHHADNVVLLESGRGERSVSGLLAPAEAMLTSPIYPPVIGLGRALGWTPLPLSVRDARRRAVVLRERLGAPEEAPAVDRTGAEPVVAVSGLAVRRGTVPALRDVDLDVAPGEIVALMGRNGAGKSTLLAALVGQVAREHGSVRVGTLDPARAKPAHIVRQVGLVPQDPSLILYASSVAEECAAADTDFGLEPGTSARVLERILPGVEPTRHPHDLSEGQRLSVALALILASDPRVVLLDEPTRGLDYGAKRRLVSLLQELSAGGHAVMLATHDVELAAEVASRVVVLADGDVVADGPVRQVLSGSPAFAPQVAKILHPVRLLTVDEVVDAAGAAS